MSFFGKIFRFIGLCGGAPNHLEEAELFSMANDPKRGASRSAKSSVAKCILRLKQAIDASDNLLQAKFTIEEFKISSKSKQTIARLLITDLSNKLWLKLSFEKHCETQVEVRLQSDKLEQLIKEIESLVRALNESRRGIEDSAGKKMQQTFVFETRKDKNDKLVCFFCFGLKNQKDFQFECEHNVCSNCKTAVAAYEDGPFARCPLCVAVEGESSKCKEIRHLCETYGRIMFIMRGGVVDEFGFKVV